MTSINEPKTILSSAARAANGNTQATPTATDYGYVIVFYLDVTAVSGTNPTLDLYVDIRDPVTGKWINQDKFVQVSGIGTFGLALTVRSNSYSVRWVLGGTSPSFTFSLGAVVIK